MRVTYERLFNLGNYNNERISLEDDVQDGESPEGTYWRLRTLVYQMAGQRDPKAPAVEDAIYPEDTTYDDR